MHKRPIIVGEDNPYADTRDDDDKYALYPSPAGSAGARLCFKVMGLNARAYLKMFERTNLCYGRYHAMTAFNHATHIRMQNWDVNRAYVLLGAKVCTAFQIPFEPFTSFGQTGDSYVILPHPSGRSRYWNEFDSVKRARIALAAGDVQLQCARCSHARHPDTSCYFEFMKCPCREDSLP